MICNNCESTLRDGVTFCTNCGTRTQPSPDDPILEPDTTVTLPQMPDIPEPPAVPDTPPIVPPPEQPAFASPPPPEQPAFAPPPPVHNPFAPPPPMSFPGTPAVRTHGIPAAPINSKVGKTALAIGLTIGVIILMILSMLFGFWLALNY